MTVLNDITTGVCPIDDSLLVRRMLHPLLGFEMERLICRGYETARHHRCDDMKEFVRMFEAMYRELKRINE